MTQRTIEENKVEAVIQDIAQELAPLVDDIESETCKTTQHGYGRYMTVMAQLGQGDRDMIGIIALALLKVGANVEGVRWAYRLSI